MVSHPVFTNSFHLKGGMVWMDAGSMPKRSLGFLHFNFRGSRTINCNVNMLKRQQVPQSEVKFSIITMSCIPHAETNRMSSTLGMAPC